MISDQNQALITSFLPSRTESFSNNTSTNPCFSLLVLTTLPFIHLLCYGKSSPKSQTKQLNCMTVIVVDVSV